MKNMSMQDNDDGTVTVTADGEVVAVIPGDLDSLAMGLAAAHPDALADLATKAVMLGDLS